MSMRYLVKDSLAVAVNVVGTLVVYAALRLVIHTQHQVEIDYLVLLIGSTAHLWYLRKISWTRKIIIAGATAILSFYGMLTFVTAVLRDGT